MRDLLRFIPWWILAVFLAIMLVWQSRLQIAEFALSMALDGFAAKGLTIEDLDYQLESLDLSSLTFSSFNFSVDDPEQKIRVSGQQLSVSYTLENLYRGRLNEIKADSLNIQIEETPDSKLIRVAPENYLKLMERAISTPFPIAQISVKELSLEHNGNRSQRYNPVILSISSAQNFSTVKLTHSRWQAVAHTTINGDRNQISATLTSTPGDDETTELATLMMEIVAQQHNKPRAEGLLTLSLENFLQWGFKPLEKTTTITQSGESAATSPTGQIALEFAIVTDSIERNFRLDLQARSPELHYSGRSANNINLKTSIDFPEEIEYPKLGKIDIKSLNLSVEQLKTPEMLVQNLSINKHGIITLEHKTLSATLKPQTRVEAETLDITGIHLKNVRFDPVLTLVEIENSYKIDLLKGTAFSADSLKAEGVSTTQLQTLVTQDLHILLSGHNQDNAWKVESGKLIINKPDIHYHSENPTGIRNTKLEAEKLEIKTDLLSESSQTISVFATAPEVILDEQSIALESAIFDLSKNGSSLQSTGEFEFRDIPPAIAFSMEAQDIHNQLNFNLNQTTPLKLSPYYPHLINILDRLQLANETLESLNFDQGEFSGSAQASWNSRQGLVGLINISLKNASGQFDDISFSGLNISGPIILPPEHKKSDKNKQTNTDYSNIDSASINIDHLEYGTELENIEMNIRLIESQNSELPALKITDLKAEILGSNLSSPKFVYDPGSDTSTIDLSINNLDIGKVIELQQIEGLDASGKLDGMLPLKISNQGFSISGGKFNNQKDGGVIHYNVDPSVAQSLDNPLTDTVLSALSEFSYQVLTADVDYQPDGELLVNFHIEGSSPNLENNRPVHLNINSEQNVLSLLASLEYANKLNRGIDKKLRESLPVSD